MKKRTNEQWLEEARAISDEYEWLEEYKGSQTNIAYKHICGHTGTIKPTDFLKGHGCPICGHKRGGSAKRAASAERWECFIAEHIDEYTWLEPYIDNRTKIRYRHKCGHIGSISPQHFLKGHGCAKCHGKHKRTNEQWLEEARAISDEYEWLEEYKGTNSSIAYRHICGYAGKITPKKFLRGQGCAKCGNALKKTNGQWLDEAKAISDEYEWLEEYKGTNKQIKYKHICGHTGMIRPADFLKGHGCPICAKEKAKRTGLANNGVAYPMQSVSVREKSRSTLNIHYGVDHPSKSEIIHARQLASQKAHYADPTLAASTIAKRKATNISKIGVGHHAQVNRTAEQIRITENATEFRRFISDNWGKTADELSTMLGYIHRSSLYILLDKYGGEIACKNRSDGAEKEICSLFGLFPTHSVLDGNLEIDCYNPTKKVGVEFNGAAWHCAKFKQADYHDQKTRIAQEKGIRLIHIWDWEWETKREQCISLIKNALGGNTEKYDARKLKVSAVGNTEYNSFMAEFHIQGTSQATVRLGLYAGAELIMAIGFVRKRDGWNLVRMASKARVSGGASRLMKAFERQYAPKWVDTFCDTGKFSGGVYAQMGFHKVGEVKPRYVWVERNTLEVKSRRSCQKQYICETPDDRQKTETQLMSERGYVQCFGSHLDKYLKKSE